MRSLFPEMEREIAQDRLAERREQKQRARELLRQNPGYEKFVMNHLTAKGPSVDANMGLELAEACDASVRDALLVILVAHAMWRMGKLWQKPLKKHFCGATFYLYGIRGVHPVQK